jgi:hypothetical protein
MDDVDGVGSRSGDADDAMEDAMECAEDEVEYVLDDKPQMVGGLVSECLPSIWHTSTWLLLQIWRQRSA